MKKIIYSILVAHNLYCAEQPKEPLKLGQYPIDILGKIAEFMPSDSKFVNDTSRLVELSPEKYFNIALALVKDSHFSFDILNSDLKYHIIYDYDDIPGLVDKYFSTTSAKKLSNEKLKENMRIAFTQVLKENPLILFMSSIKKNNINNLNEAFEHGARNLLFIDKNITDNNSLNLDHKTDNELIDMRNRLEVELKFLQNSRSYLERTNISYPNINYNVGIFKTLGDISYRFLEINLMKKNQIKEFTNRVNLIKNKINSLLNNYDKYELAFYTEYRKRIPVSSSEIKEAAKIGGGSRTLEDQQKRKLLLGLSDVTRDEIANLFENESAPLRPKPHVVYTSSSNEYQNQLWDKYFPENN